MYRIYGPEISGMRLTGIADEAGVDIDTQISAHKQLGWDTIELRFINGKNVAGDLDEKEFEIVREKLAAANMKVSCSTTSMKVEHSCSFTLLCILSHPHNLVHNFANPLRCEWFLNVIAHALFLQTRHAGFAACR